VRLLRNVLLLVVFIAAILPAPCSLASTNIFTEADINALKKVEADVLALTGDIENSTDIINRTDGDSSQVDCLHGLHEYLLPMLGDFILVHNLVDLSWRMEDPRDASKINSRLAAITETTPGVIAITRRNSLQMAAICSTSALVNTYAQKAMALADNATAAISAIKDRLASDTNSQ
jgi:hypothetical protein